MLGTANENPSRLSSHDWLAFNTAQEAWFPGLLMTSLVNLVGFTKKKSM